MTIPNFNVPGVTYKVFCTFSCTNEAEGEMQMEFDGETISVPVCGSHAQSLLDRLESNVVD
jgi:hypothetical protein